MYFVYVCMYVCVWLLNKKVAMVEVNKPLAFLQWVG